MNIKRAGEKLHNNTNTLKIVQDAAHQIGRIEYYVYND